MMMNDLQYCPETTMQLVEIDEELTRIYNGMVAIGVTEDVACRTIYDDFVQLSSEKIVLYRDFFQEFFFTVEKMKAFAKVDRMIQFVVTDLQSRDHDEESSLRVTFNGYVLEDSAMRSVYRTL